MHPPPSYRDAHQDPAVGSAYDGCMASNPWQRFLWAQERAVLDDLLRRRYAGREIHLLDFACGTGRVAAFLEPRVTCATAVDVSATMLRQARRKLQRTELRQVDITAIDGWTERSFNLITAFRFVANAEPGLRRAAMRALARRLEPSGYLVFNNHQHEGAPWIRLARWRRRLPRLRLERAGLVLEPGDTLQTMSIPQMIDLAAHAGLDVVELIPVGFHGFPGRIDAPRAAALLEHLGRQLPGAGRLADTQIAVCRHRTRRCAR